ncbi:hypothetical protein PspS35_29695 [Pseudomonas sp. S35]|uniref:hypothetical protein n=1 Tax=Pseudomonas sp. S35 TaxID=1573719 RepID=UPI00132EBB66|nr:hypothetical protein [Pseudomonas sp. S35]QHF47771.1 hypothetical protein PspS35_29695 [Pseudomonas sp. S35]
MSTSTSTPAGGNNANLELITQLYAGPSFRDAATALLRQSLQQQYPALGIDPSITLLATPAWDVVNDQIVARPTEYHALSDILVKQAVLATPTLCIEGEHFLTRHPVTEPAIHLPVRITDIARTLNTLAPVLLSAYQEQLVAYWNASNGNGPHWHTLSSTLRSAWNVEPSEQWDAVDCAMARRLYYAPDRSIRQVNDPFDSKAYLIDFARVDGAHPAQLGPTMIAALIGQDHGRTLILTYSLLNGHEKFASLEQLGQSLPAHLGTSAAITTVQWRLFEPSGNFFDQLACAMIAQQVEAVGAMTFEELRQADPSQINRTLNTTQAADNGAITQNGRDLSWYHHSLPDWLSLASTTDLNFYARHLKDLAALNSQNAGQPCLEDIPPIQEYALEQIKQQMLQDHPDAENLALEKLVMQVRSVVTWGTFIVPGVTDTATFTLAELALQNLIAVPIGKKSIQLRNGKNLPAWLDVDYVESLISQVDIGKTYPELIKHKLLDIREEAARRKNLYAQQLRIQLPLMALQSKIRQEHAIDERGYRYVAALMAPDAADHYVDGQAIVMRPLAFVPQRRKNATQDAVANMYVIGPRNVTAGPCLLYRPLFEPPLVQYRSPANLIYAITQAPELRDTVLAWLPDAAHSDYANYVFPADVPSPWAVADFLVEPDKLLALSGPMTLGDRSLSGDVLGALFDANTQALIELADRQSVSNAERRWATLKQAGWVLFNAVLPFASRAVNTAAWIWQIVDQLQQFAEAQALGQKQAEWTALTDVLLNLGMAITLHIAMRSQRPVLPGETKSPPALPAAEPIEIKQLPTYATHDTPPNQHSSLFTSGAINRLPEDLATVLDSFKVDKPPTIGTAIKDQGTYQHLYRSQGKYYAPIGTRWFEVAVQADEPLVIVDPKQPERVGPALIHNAQGDWFIDTRLRLRGGGPKRAIKKADDAATLKAAEVRSKLEAFENTKKAAQQELQRAHLDMTQAPETSASAKRQHYLDKLNSQRSDYETALQHLQTLNVFSPLTDYQPRALAYVKAQLDLSQAGIREAQTRFTPQLRTVLEQVERQAQAPLERHIEDARRMTSLNQDMITRLDYVQSRFEQLKSLALDGLRLVQERRKQMPSYTSHDLKALNVTLSRNLCLTESSLESTPSAWTALDHIINTADIAIQTLRDTLQERSEARLDERIEALASLIEQFSVIDERLDDLPQDFASAIIPEQVEHLRKQISDFSNASLAHLSRLHTERDSLRNRPTPPPTPPRPKRKFIHTRYNGMLIGEPRLTALGLETDLVDIRSPLTQQIIATYHEKEPGVWVQRITESEPSPVSPPMQACIDDGQAYLDGLASFLERADQQAQKAGRTPVGIEYLLHQHAQLLELAEKAIEQTLARDPIPDHQRRTATIVSRKLKEAVIQVYRRATQHMVQMTKQQPPTMIGVEWLRNRNAITLKKVINRRRIKGPRPDYLDEYTITERGTHNLLWYAHFHYSAAWTAPKAFLSARLKTPAEQRRGSQADTLSGLNQQQRTDYYRSEINLDQARRVFFNA